MTTSHHDTAARRWFGRAFDELRRAEQRVIETTAHRRLVATDTNAQFAGDLTFGQRLADRVAQFGGSWTFILLFAGALVTWALLNTKEFLFNH